MTVVPALLCLLTQTQKVDKPKLELYQRTFVVREGREVEQIPLHAPQPESKPAMLFRRGATFVCWDRRGLTLREGPKARGTRLPELAVSPRLFSKEEILETLDLVRKGRRKREASALSGAMRVGGEVYLLLRWDDSEGKPWLESLVAVNVRSKNAKPKLIGRFEGFTLATGAIGRELFVLGDRLAAVTQSDQGWGVGTFDVAKSKFEFSPLGDTLQAFLPQGETKGLFLERTSYDTTVAGRVDLKNLKRKTLAEGPGRMKFVDDQNPPLAIVVGPHGHVVRNLVTGAELPISAGTGIRRGKSGVVIWSPVAAPAQASLMNPRKWTLRAVWAQALPEEPKRVPTRKRKRLPKRDAPKVGDRLRD